MRGWHGVSTNLQILARSKQREKSQRGCEQILARSKQREKSQRGWHVRGWHGVSTNLQILARSKQREKSQRGCEQILARSKQREKSQRGWHGVRKKVQTSIRMLCESENVHGNKKQMLPLSWVCMHDAL